MAFSVPPFSFASLMDFFFGNIVWFLLFGGAIYIILNYFKFGIRDRIKPVNRAEVERINFIQRMKENKPEVYKYLKRGNQMLGRIVAMRVVEMETTNPHKKTMKLCQMVVKPTIWKSSIMNPIAKSRCFSINTDKVQTLNNEKGLIQLPATLTFDYLLGIYYDGSVESLQSDFIKQDNLFRSDLNTLASIYYAKSQEQSTFDPDKAHALAMKEKELQIEMAKKQGKITTI